MLSLCIMQMTWLLKVTAFADFFALHFAAPFDSGFDVAHDKKRVSPVSSMPSTSPQPRRPPTNSKASNLSFGRLFWDRSKLVRCEQQKLASNTGPDQRESWEHCTDFQQRPNSHWQRAFAFDRMDCLPLAVHQVAAA